jgi:enediyne biosynthesis protein E4
MLLRRLIVPGILISLASCSPTDESKQFTLLGEDATGIAFKNEIFEGEQMNVMNYGYFYNGSGVAIGDINNDGLQDILFTGNMVKNRLYLNKGNLKFENITDKSGIADKQGWCTGATMVDINADGKLDIYICRSADGDPVRRRNLLFINNGDLTFTERAGEYGLADEGYSTQAAFLDYDKDNDLDMFVINHSLQQYTGGVQEMTSIRSQKNPHFASKLYRNDNNRFKNVSDSAGITSNVLSFGLGLAIADINSDGWPDVHVSNDFNEPDYLFINNKDGTFSERLAECMDHISLFSMGSDFADYNNDGFQDLVTLDMLPEDNRTQKMHSGAENFDKMQMLFNKGFYFQFSRNMLHRNNGDGTFSEVAQIAGVSNTDWSWASLFSDFDHDGYKDLFVSNGYVKDYTELDFLKYTVDETVKAQMQQKEVAVNDFIAKMPTNRIPNYIFQNKGDGSFIKRTKDWGFDQIGVSAGAAYADLDNDGDLDLVLNNTNDVAGVYRNNGNKENGNNYLRVNLQGDKKNSLGIGAKVTVYCKNELFFQEQQPVRGFQSSVDPILNFGIGKHAVIDSVRIIWPDDRAQLITNVEANETIQVKHAEAADLWQYVNTASVDAYYEADSLAYSHRENIYNDFNTQLLLPHYLSRQGPCVAKGDVNSDGREDLYFGGAKGQAGQLFLQSPGGRYVLKSQPSLLADSMYEDVSAEFFDADGDNDLDLYVGSGGYEFEDKNPQLKDRLYINDSKGNFSVQPSSIPDVFVSTGCVRAADIDGDGDTDIFEGGRVVPGKYPLAPSSKILLNDGRGVFTDATSSVAPALQNAGMITDAQWIDLNGDKLPELILAGEWMPIMVFANNNGKLTDASSTYIHFKSRGWWNRIYADDFDGDGDLDLVAGNLGLNAQFRASEKEPVRIHFKDFDGNGSIDPILSYYIDGKSYPALSRDDLMDQLPMLKKKYLMYSTYANASMDDLFEPELMKNASVLHAENLATVYLENNGKSGFTMKPLPAEAQYAPVFGIVSVDANNDGKKDLVLAGNNVWTRIRFSRYDANHGILLQGDGKGNFTYVPQWKSGFRLRGDIRAVEKIGNGNDMHLVFGVNNSRARVYRVNNK